MCDSQPVPEPPKVITLGSLSKIPDFFPKEEDGNDATTFWSPMEIFHDAVGIVGSAVDTVGSAVASLPGVDAAATQIATGLGQLVDPNAYQEIFPGLGQVRHEPTVVGQVMGRARDISQDSPPIWYVNLPTNMSDGLRQELRERVQAMADFKCWSSLKWWADVFKEVPTTEGFVNKMLQSNAFVKYAAADLWGLEWFRSNDRPTRTGKSIDCRMSELHRVIMDMAIGTFHALDDISRQALEPIFEGLMSSTGDGVVGYWDQRTVLAEKHEFNSSTGSIVSSIRLISFQVGESFYALKDGKNSSRAMVRCDIEFVQFDAEFDMARWNAFAQEIDPDQKRAAQDFVFGQTIEMDPENLEERARRYIEGSRGIMIDVPI